MHDNIRALAKQYLPDIQRVRRDLHAHPELAHQEFETQAKIIAELQRLGVAYSIKAETGILAEIHGSKPGKTVLLRGDMDALPILETADVDYKSTVDGVMHACGHDGHTAGLLGAVYILNEMKEHLCGTVKFMFQPAEETDGGAQPMIDEGIMENPKVDAAFGLHLGGHLQHGLIQVKHGAMYGAPDEFELEIIGRGGHAASPEQTIDPISVAIQIIQNAQFMLTRRLDPVKPTLISFTTIHAGEGLNVIPEHCKVGGTIRTLYPDSREQVQAYLEQIIQHVCEMNGAQYNFNFLPSYPPLINDDAMTDFAQRTLTSFFGEKRVSEQEFPTLGAEDFAFVCQAVPASYFIVGIWEDGKPEPIHHHPQFQWNDEILETCSSALALLAYEFLSEASGRN